MLQTPVPIHFSAHFPHPPAPPGPPPQPFIGTFSQHNDDLRRVPSFLERRRCRPARNCSQTLWTILEGTADTLAGMQRLCSWAQPFVIVIQPLLECRIKESDIGICAYGF